MFPNWNGKGKHNLRGHTLNINNEYIFSLYLDKQPDTGGNVGVRHLQCEHQPFPCLHHNGRMVTGRRYPSILANRSCSLNYSSDIGVNRCYKLIFWLVKRYNSLALIGQKLLSCISCPIRIWVCNNRSLLLWHQPDLLFTAARRCSLFSSFILYFVKFMRCRRKSVLTGVLTGPGWSGLSLLCHVLRLVFTFGKLFLPTGSWIRSTKLLETDIWSCNKLPWWMSSMDTT